MVQKSIPKSLIRWEYPVKQLFGYYIKLEVHQLPIITFTLSQ